MNVKQEIRTNIISFNVPTILREGAARAIVSALSQLDGVDEVIVNSSARLVQAHYDGEKVDAAALVSAIEATGHPVQRYSDGYR